MFKRLASAAAEAVVTLRRRGADVLTAHARETRLRIALAGVLMQRQEEMSLSAPLRQMTWKDLECAFVELEDLAFAVKGEGAKLSNHQAVDIALIRFLSRDDAEAEAAEAHYRRLGQQGWASIRSAFVDRFG